MRAAKLIYPLLRLQSPCQTLVGVPGSTEIFYLLLASSVLDGEHEVVTHSVEEGRGPPDPAQWVPLRESRELTHTKVRWVPCGIGEVGQGRGLGKWGRGEALTAPSLQQPTLRIVGIAR